MVRRIGLICVLCLFLCLVSPVLFAQQTHSPPPWQVDLASGVLLPLGSAADLLDLGIMARFLGSYEPLPFPLSLAGAAGVSRHDVSGADSLLTIDGSVGIGVRLPAGPLDIGIYGLAGYGYSTLSGLDSGSASDGNAIMRSFVVLGLPVGGVNLAFTGGYFRSFGLLDGIELGLSLAYPGRSTETTRAPGEQREPPLVPEPLVENAPESDAIADDGTEVNDSTTAVQLVSQETRVERSSSGLRVRTLAFEPLFPVFAAYYEGHGFGVMELHNESRQTLENISATVYIDRVMDVPSALDTPVSLAPGETALVALTALFSSGILEITESTRIALDLQVSFDRRGRTREMQLSDVVDVHDRNAVIWDDDRKVASFVTSRDPDVLRLSRQAASVMRSRGSQVVNQELRAAVALFDTMKTIGLSYVIDPSSPYAKFSGNAIAIDYVQFPRQTMEYRSGDCDDLSILFAALAESTGQEAAFVTVPGHIYAALRIPLDPDEARSTFSRPDDLLFVDDLVWLPVETTALGGSFLEAWQLGARQWRENRERAAIIPIRSAWEEYPPVGLGGDSEAAPTSITDQLAVAYEADLLEVVEREIYPEVARLRTRYEASRDPRYLNRIAVVYARYGLYARAREELNGLLRNQARNVPALVNLGNIEFLNDRYGDALQMYERALTIMPQHPTALLGAARSHHSMENYGLVGRYFDQLRTVEPNLAERFAYLDFRGEEATRAADAAGIQNLVVWDEGEYDE